MKRRTLFALAGAALLAGCGFQLRSRVRFRVRSAAGRDLVPETELEQHRDISFNESAVLAKEAEESLRRQGVRRALDALPERERRILELRFGFEGEPWTLEAIGHELDLTRERVRQLEGQALSRLAALRELAGLAA